MIQKCRDRVYTVCVYLWMNEMDVVSQTRRVKVIKDNAIVCEKTRLNSYMLLAEKEVCDTLKLSLMIITQEEKKRV